MESSLNFTRGKEYCAFIELTVSDEMFKIIRETFNIEIEILKGFSERLEDGRMFYKFQVKDQQKGEMLKEFCLKLISKSHEQVLN